MVYLSKLFTDAVPCFAVIQPTVEGALYAIAVDYLSSNSQMRTHVQAIGVECVHNAIFSSVNDQVLAGNINCFNLSFFELCDGHDVVPSVGIWR